MRFFKARGIYFFSIERLVPLKEVKTRTFQNELKLYPLKTLPQELCVMKKYPFLTRNLSVPDVHPSMKRRSILSSHARPGDLLESPQATVIANCLCRHKYPIYRRESILVRSRTLKSSFKRNTY